MKPFDIFDRNIELLADKIINANHLIVFTGAGISTESGIPDYRSKGGIWEKFRPVYIDEFMSSREARELYWRRKAELYPDLMNARPNAAHNGLAELYKMGYLRSVITQNIDGLHQKAGMADDAVIELHGNTMRVRCMNCGALSSIDDAQKRIERGDQAPECACGGYLKPDTISFGQALDTAVLEKAYTQCRNCDMMLVIGSTLLVHPAAGLPEIAKSSGAFLAIINLSETPCDGMSDIVINGKAGMVMKTVVEEVNKMGG
jgi:NAD-dependent deacetylase